MNKLSEMKLACPIQKLCETFVTLCLSRKIGTGSGKKKKMPPCPPATNYCGQASEGRRVRHKDSKIHKDVTFYELFRLVSQMGEKDFYFHYQTFNFSHFSHSFL